MPELAGSVGHEQGGGNRDGRERPLERERRLPSAVKERGEHHGCQPGGEAGPVPPAEGDGAAGQEGVGLGVDAEPHPGVTGSGHHHVAV